MYLLYDFCGGTTLDPVWSIVGFIVKAIWIGIPILLIIFGMIDLGKAVIASKEDEVKKATKAFGKRFLYAVAVFAVVWIVTVVLDTVATVAGPNAVNYDEAGWQACWCKISKGIDHEFKPDTDGNLKCQKK